MDHDPRTIRSFVQLAQSLSFTRAAEQLGLTQPQLSARIKGLEQQLGFALFSRTSRRVEITPGGQQFLESARRYLVEAENLERIGLTIRRRHAMSIRVGAGSCHAEVRWALLGRFMELHPEIELNVTLLHDSAELWSGLRSGEIDVALVVPPVPDEFAFQTISSATAGLIMRSDNPLAQRDAVAPRLLTGQQVAMFPRRIFPTLHDQVVAGLSVYGPWFSELPEPGTECIASLVRATGVPALGIPWWRTDRERPEGIVFREIEGHRIPLDSVMVRSRSRSSEAVNLLWRIGAHLGGQGTVDRPVPVAANDAPPPSRKAKADLSLR